MILTKNIPVAHVQPQAGHCFFLLMSDEVWAKKKNK